MYPVSLLTVLSFTDISVPKVSAEDDIEPNPKVDEDLGVRVGLEDLAVTLSFEDREELRWGHVATGVVDGASGVDIITVWLVEDLSWEWVLGVVGNIVLREDDDLVLWDTVVLHDVEGVADVGLVSVVPVSV